MIQNSSFQQYKHEEREAVVLENEGMKIFGILHKPLQAAAERCPAVIICHGFGGNSIGYYNAYVEIASQLSKYGVATLRIDFRGSGNSEGNITEMTLNSAASDALVGLSFLAQHPEIDKNKLGVLGRSFGGAVATMAASKFENIKSLCLWAPIFDGQQWIELREKFKTIKSAKDYKTGEVVFNGHVPGYDLLKEMFTLKMSDYLKAIPGVPLLLIHGCKDSVVHLQHSEKYVSDRAGCRGETRLIQLPESDHLFSIVSERNHGIEETCKWFAQTL